MGSKQTPPGIGSARRRAASSAGSRKPGASASVDLWRYENVGRLLNDAVTRFSTRVLALMVEAGHRSTRMSHVRLTKSLDRTGTSITTLAHRSSMTKQAMGELIDQCAALGIVKRKADPRDGRVRIVTFTPRGLLWLKAFEASIAQAEREMGEEIGKGQLERLRKVLIAYGGSFNPLTPLTEMFHDKVQGNGEGE
jgi:DNA-binding MarR family transcriptional regulator